MRRHWFLACLIAASFASTLKAAPGVAKLVPENGAKNVPVELEQISVTFDQDMDQGGFSFIGGGPTFPETTGRPYWKDKRTCILPVKLKPNHEYTIGINNARFTNFKGADGTPVEPVRLKFTTAAAAKPMTVEERKATAIRKLKTAIDTRYSYKDVRKGDWPSLWKQFEPKLRAAKTPHEFAVAAGEMLANTKDPHIWLKVDGQTVPAFRPQSTANANFTLLPQVIDDWQMHGKVAATGMAAPKIGYIATFFFGNEHGAEAYEVLYQALEKFADLPGIIIDSRFNGGGNELLAREFAGCFLKEKSLYGKHVTIHPGGFSQPSERWLEPSTGRPAYSGKVAVLTGPAIMSSAEAFLLMMKQAPNAKLIGAASYGSSGNPQPHDLGNGVTVMLPSWKAMLPDGTFFEGTGIAPDIEVETEPDDFKRRDPIIREAIKWLED